MRVEDVSIFPLGEKNEAFAQYFVGQSYLNMLTTEGIPIGNVTFEPACRNNWHIHHAVKGGGQLLLVTAGRGYYQEWGSEARELKAGDVVVIPAGVKHWHGAAPDSWFAHLAVEVPGEETRTEWLEAVSDEDYGKLK
ncbi:MAG: cupin domain-containing protein [Oscillospiraceae bacterium]|nr:cupin domain-containing protein [Oscillospiraceae bacterium]